MSTDEDDNVVELDPKRAKQKDSDKVLENKWGKRVMALGYTVVPSVILRAQPRLHIGATELAVLIHLLDHWWQPEEMPWPAKATLAERLGVSAKSIQRAIVQLENEGLLKREDRYKSTGGRSSNRYDLSPLVSRLQTIAAEIEQASEEAAAVKRSAHRPGVRPKARAKAASA